MSVTPVFIVPQEKLTKYLLDLDHIVGGAKAKYLIARGFDPSNPDSLAAALIAHGVGGWPGVVQGPSRGMLHRVSAPMTMPDGSAAIVRTIWRRRSRRKHRIIHHLRPETMRKRPVA